MNVSMSEDFLVNSSRSKFFCPGAPLIIWDLERKVFIQLGIALSAVIGSFAVLLNILVILAIKKTRELQTNYHFSHQFGSRRSHSGCGFCPI